MTKIGKKLIYLTLLLVVASISLKNVKADSVGFAYKAFRDGNGNVKWRIQTGSMTLNAGRFISPNGISAYCIEPSVESLDISQGNYDINYDYTTFSSATGLSFDKIRELSLISYYGYGFNNDYSDEVYLATQLEIWNAVSPGCCSVISGDATSVESKRNTIRNYVSKEKVLPSFNNQKKDIIVNVDNVITDNNGVLNGYTVDYCENCQAYINGNNLIVKSDNLGDGKIKMKRKIGNSNQTNILYTKDNYQKMMTFYSPDAIYANLDIHIKGGILNLQKIDEDTKEVIAQGEATLEGAVFSIKDESGKEVAQITTDSDGKAQIELPLGKYYLQEIIAPKGYNLNPNVYEFEFSVDHLEENMKVADKVISGYGIIEKKYGDDELGFKLEEGAEFEIINSNGEVVDIIKTDSEGIAATKLPYGTYVIHQIKGLDNHKFMDDIIFTVEEHKVNYKFKVKNISYPRIEITKTDISNNEVIEGATIQIYKLNEETNEYELFYEGVTDKKGKILINNVELGKYYFVETKAPKGYLLNEEKHYFEVSEYGITYRETLSNEKIVEVPNTLKNDYLTWIMIGLIIIGSGVITYGIIKNKKNKHK